MPHILDPENHIRCFAFSHLFFGISIGMPVISWGSSLLYCSATFLTAGMHICFVLVLVTIPFDPFWGSNHFDPFPNQWPFANKAILSEGSLNPSFFQEIWSQKGQARPWLHHTSPGEIIQPQNMVTVEIIVSLNAGTIFCAGHWGMIITYNHYLIIFPDTVSVR